MMKGYLLLLTFFLSLSHALYSQQADKDLAEKIDRCIWDSEFQKAIDLIDMNQAKAPNLAIALQNKKADALIRMGRLQEAEQLLAELAPRLESLPARDVQRAVACGNLGLLQLNVGRTDRAEEELQKAMTLFEQAGKPGCLDAAQTLSCLGLVYLNTGKYTQAEQQLQMALALRQDQLSDSHELIAATYNDLGLVYSQTDKDKALDYYEKALTIYKKLHGDSHLKIAYASLNNGVIYRDIESYGEAVNSFETALKIFQQVHTQAHPAKAIALYNLGQTYLKMRNPKAAMEYYQQALKMYGQSYGEKHPEVANVLNAIGNLQLSEYRYDDALASYQRALTANVPDFNSTDLHSNPSLETFYNGTRLLQSLLFKAQALESRYYGKTIRFADLDEALAVLHLCDKLVDKLRQQSNFESDKILLGVVANDVYADGVRIAYAAGLNAFKKKPYYEQAFYFAEKSKSAVLLGAISDANAKSFAGIPANLLDRENELKSSLSACARRLAQRPAPDEEKMIREKAFALQRAYDDFIRKLEHDFPDYFNLKFNQASPAIEDVQAVLDAETTMVSYFIDERSQRAEEKGDRLYIFEIGHKTYRVEERTLPENFDKRLTGLRNSLYYNEPVVYKKTAHELFKLLIPKSLPGATKKLIILPTGRLGIVPFEALLTKPAEGNAYKTFPYLLNRYGVQYEFSAGLLLQKSHHKKTDAHPSIFLCAPVRFPEKDGLNDLPGTELEVNGISTLFGTKQYTSKLFTGRDASESLIKSDALAQYSYIHLATHGVVDEARPELSRIFLQTSPAEDGHLFAGEIYNLKLNANLVTLSACQTGLGKISKGEGVIGLSRALVYAGARNIIVSFWNVADESTAALMKNFYATLLDAPGATLSEDLRNAKLALVAGDTYASPYYWAPFVLIGF